MLQLNFHPREKLARSNPNELEDKELLAIILGHGTKKESVFTISERLLKNFDQEELLNIKNVHYFQKNFHLSHYQACQLIATFEIGRRYFSKNLPVSILRSTEQAYELTKTMKYLRKEYVRGLYFNTRYQLVHDEILTIGSLDGNIIHPREVFRPAIEYGAYGLILAHNHPSHDPTPSQNDLEITQKLAKTGVLLQIPLLDHLIIGENGYSSLYKMGFL